MYMCVYIDTYTYISPGKGHTCTHACTHMCTHTHINMCVYMYVYINICICVCIYTCTDIYNNYGQNFLLC